MEINNKVNNTDNNKNIRIKTNSRERKISHHQLLFGAILLFRML